MNKTTSRISFTRLKEFVLPAVIILIFAVISVLTLIPSPVDAQLNQDERLNKLFNKYELVKIETQLVNRGNLNVSFTANKQRFDIELTPNQIFSLNYKAVEMQGDVIKAVKPSSLKTYEGVVKDRTGTARFTEKEGIVEGAIFTPNENYFLEPLNKYFSSAKSDEYIFYRSSDLKFDESRTCGLSIGKEKSANTKSTQSRKQSKTQVFSNPASYLKEVELAIEADTEFVRSLGGAENAQDEITRIINQVDGVYKSLSLTIKITHMRFWESGQPYTSTHPDTLLKQLKDRCNIDLVDINRDAVHLFTGKDLNGTVVGIAYRGEICNHLENSYGLSQLVTSANQKIAVTAHEIGHNFSATHPDEDGANSPDCLGRIMNSKVLQNVVMNFCAYSRRQIEEHIANYPDCLSQIITPPVLTPDFYEENDTRQTAREMTIGISNRLNVKFDDEDWYRINVPPGKRVAVFSTDSEMSFGTVYFQLFRGNSAVPVSTSVVGDYPRRVEDTNNTNNQLTYYVRVFVDGIQSIYNMDLEVGDCNAVPIDSDQTIRGNLSPSACSYQDFNYYRRYSIELLPSQLFFIKASSTDFNTYLRLKGPDGVMVAQDDNGGGGTNSRIPAGNGWQTFLKGGKYTIEVSSVDKTKMGNFDLTFIKSSQSCFEYISPTSWNAPHSGGSYSFKVTADSNCGWSVGTGAEWILISENTGAGTKVVNFTVKSNPSMTTRTGTIWVDGRSFTISQRGFTPLP